MTVAVRPAPSAAGEWLSIREASELVGVSVATLRRWCDAGEVHAFTTPGGHRRFARSAVLRIATPAMSPQRMADNPHVWRRVVRACRLALRNADASAPVLAHLSPDSQRELRRQGSIVLAGLLSAVDARTRDRAIALAPARRALGECVLIAAREGLTLSQALDLSLQFRSLLMRELSTATRRMDWDAGSAVSVLLAASEALDGLLVQLIESYVTIEVNARDG